MSRYSTSSKSPGFAPFTYTGPVSGWAMVRSSRSRSFAVVRGPICRSFASRVSSASSSPGSTSTIGAMSGCQRLWPVCGSSRRRLPRSIATCFTLPPWEMLCRLALLGVGLELHLNPARLAPVECLVRLDRVGEGLGLRQHLRRVDHAARDEVDEVRQVLAVRRFARLDGEVLLHRLADREEPPLGIDADDGKRARLGEAFYRPLEHLRRRIARAPLPAARVGLGRELLQLLAELGAMLLRLLRRRAFARRYRIDAHRVDGTVRTDAASEAREHLDRVLAVEGDHFRDLV